MKKSALTKSTELYVKNLTSNEFYYDAKRITSLEFKEQRAQIMDREKALITIEDHNDISGTMMTIWKDRYI